MLLILLLAAAVAEPAPEPVVVGTETRVVAGKIEIEDPAEPPKPLGNPGSWASTMDYPSSALREELEGVSRFSLVIDTGGRVMACTITQSSGHEVLDEATCRLMRERATFTPAKDAKGNPIVGTWSSSVRWAIPGEGDRGPRGLPSPSDMEIAMVIGADGLVESCTTTKRDGVPDYFDPCESMRSAQYVPGFSADGEPVKKRLIMRSTVTVEDVAE